MDCLFCKIANKEIPAQIVFEDEDIMAFRDIAPQAPVHILIVTKKHFSGLNDFTGNDSDLLGRVMDRARQLAKKENVSEDGYRVVLNCGKNAGQAVAHVHWHLLGGRKFSWPPG
jgi:histidine triad (HIT) family protein